MAMELLVRLDEPEAELSVVIVNDKRIRQLNLEWLGRDHPTNVLSFSMRETNPESGYVQTPPSPVLGDVVINVQRAASDALAAGISTEAETAWLLIHGVLHLVGFNHENATKSQTMKMRRASEKMYRLLSPIVTGEYEPRP